MSDQRARGTRIARVPLLSVVGAIVVCVVLGGYVLQGRLQNTGAGALPYQAEVSPVMQKVLPQGWAFFTKPADSAAVVPHRLADGSAESVSVGEYAEPSNGFGFDRSKRRQGVESAMLLQGIGRSAWQQCDGADVGTCAADAPEPVRRANTLPNPTLCGPIVMAAEQITPWKWRDLRDEPRFVTEVVRLEVTC